MTREQAFELEDGYYWALHHDRQTTFVVLLQDEMWFTVGIGVPLINFDPHQVLCPVLRPELMTMH
jgi:hypothetical protein